MKVKLSNKYLGIIFYCCFNLRPCNQRIYSGTYRISQQWIVVKFEYLLKMTVQNIEMKNTRKRSLQRSIFQKVLDLKMTNFNKLTSISLPEIFF